MFAGVQEEPAVENSIIEADTSLKYALGMSGFTLLFGLAVEKAAGDVELARV